MSGGGTGGHIIPNIALIEELRERYQAAGEAPQVGARADVGARAGAGAPPGGDATALELLYIGSRNGMEQKMIEEIGVPFVSISCGKLRRYFSFRNIVDFFRVPVGVVQAVAVLMKFKPDVIFCKGGFVSFPVAVAGWILRKPVILHESDVSPGLANRLCSRFASTICVSFEESKKYFRHKKVLVTGNPVRRELALAKAENGLRFLGFSKDLPVVLVMGGSSGAEFINKMTWRNLEYLLPHYQVAHICGNGKVRDPEDLLRFLKPEHHQYLGHYRCFAFLDHELKDLYAAADVIVSRGGAVSLAEIDFFGKPAVLIPLGKSASRGDQILNVKAYAKDHVCKILFEGEFSDIEFIDEIQKLYKHRKSAHLGHDAGGAGADRQRDSGKNVNRFSALDKIIHLLQNP